MKVKAISHEVYSGDEIFCLLVRTRQHLEMRLESERKNSKILHDLSLSIFDKK